MQYTGLVFAMFGALIFAFHGDLASVQNFDPHIQFLWILACALYLVLLKLWHIQPFPDDGLFVLFLLGTFVLLPGFVQHATTELSPLEYSAELWCSILFVGIAMGALFLYLIGFGTSRVGVTNTSLVSFILPVLVAIESVLCLDSSLYLYQAVGGVLVACGVFAVIHFSIVRSALLETRHSAQ